MLETDYYIIGGTLGAILISYVAYRFGALSMSGAIAAIFIGSAIFGLGGYVAAAALLFFFLSGSILSRLAGEASNVLQKEARNWKQVLCNGAPAAGAVILVHFVPAYRESGTLFFLGALATATADTWATEIGIRKGKQAYHILTLQPVTQGISGGVTGMGTLAALVGAFLFALIPFALLPGDDFLCGLFLEPVLPLITAAGFIGSILDSVIGATIQAKYRRTDGTVIERWEPDASLASGTPLVTNDVTNLFSTSWGGFIAVGLTTLF